MEVQSLSRPEVEALSELGEHAPFFDADFPPTPDSLRGAQSSATQWRRITDALPGKVLVAASHRLAASKMHCGETADIDGVRLPRTSRVVPSRARLLTSAMAALASCHQAAISWHRAFHRR
eukprot:4819253-Prymnesium_polylepis.1